MKPWVGLSLMPQEDFRQAAYPLFEQGEVDVLEWSIDMGWGEVPIPVWTKELLDFYGDQRRLLGHSIGYSFLSAEWTHQQQAWLMRLADECRSRRYRRLSVHFGFMTAGSFRENTLLPVPQTSGTLRTGSEGLRKLSEIAKIPIGLENLAFAFGQQDVRDQGGFINDLLVAVEGFLVLDLHNLYCQMFNFRKTAVELLSGYPLERVCEIHVSGGSWSHPQSGGTAIPIRRDTHDGPVPEEVFELSSEVLKLCPGVEAVIFERLGDTLTNSEEITQFRKDYSRLREIVTNQKQ